MYLPGNSVSKAMFLNTGRKDFERAMDETWMEGKKDRKKEKKIERKKESVHARIIF